MMAMYPPQGCLEGFHGKHNAHLFEAVCFRVQVIDAYADACEATDQRGALILFGRYFGEPDGR